MGGQRTVSGDRRRRGESVRGCVRGCVRDPSGGWRPVRGASIGSLGAVLPLSWRERGQAPLDNEHQLDGLMLSMFDIVQSRPPQQASSR